MKHIACYQKERNIANELRIEGANKETVPEPTNRARGKSRQKWIVSSPIGSRRIPPSDKYLRSSDRC